MIKMSTYLDEYKLKNMNIGQCKYLLTCLNNLKSLNHNSLIIRFINIEYVDCQEKLRKISEIIRVNFDFFNYNK